jgi:hypothetical protein
MWKQWNYPWLDPTFELNRFAAKGNLGSIMCKREKIANNELNWFSHIIEIALRSFTAWRGIHGFRSITSNGTDTLLNLHPMSVAISEKS